jgi:hypothetical protein
MQNRILKFSSLTLFIYLCSWAILSAQPPIGKCGMTDLDEIKIQMERTIANKELVSRGLSFPRAINYVPVVFHIVSDATGAGGINEASVLDMLCGVNDFYRDNNIQFYVKQIRYIKNTTLYSSPQSVTSTMAANKQSTGLNVFIVNVINNSGGGSVLGYYQNQYSNSRYDFDCIVLIKTQVSRAASSTAAHEFGHFFSLPHTFVGWESAPFTPTTAQPCAPILNPIRTPTEYVTRTGANANCGVAADLFCDTPADYNTGYGYSGCGPIYTGNMKDPDCVLLQPSFGNLMGYFIGCETLFSTQQKANIRADLTVNTARTYLRPNFTPVLVPIVDSIRIINPANSAQQVPFNNILFDWSDVPGATNYIIEFSRFSSFAVSMGTAVVYNQSFFNYNAATYPQISPLLSNTQYYWRVRPWSNGIMCPPITINGFNGPKTFTTGLNNATNEIVGVSSMQVYPNPIIGNLPLEIKLTTSKSILGKIKIISLTGQILREENVRFDSGETSKFMDTKALSSGMYIISLETENGIINKKIVL